MTEAMLHAVARPAVAAARRIVVKIGTSVLVRDDGRLAVARLRRFAESIATLHEAGREIVLVSSGAVGVGARSLTMVTTLHDIIRRRASAAMGQGRLITYYTDAFARFEIETAQLLLTSEDFASNERRALIGETLHALFAAHAITIINENDAASDGSARTRQFHDNDMLSALIAGVANAELVILLSDVDGLYTADPSRIAHAELLRTVQGVEDALIHRIDGVGVRGRGGMAAKMRAAQVVIGRGAMVVIANGRRSGVIDSVCRGEEVGTFVTSVERTA